jgi:hypothetical protein
MPERKPRGPFNRLVGRPPPFFELLPSMYSCPRCKLCRRRSGAKIPGEHSAYPQRAVILSVGPWGICEECLKVLDEELGT